MGQGLVLSTMRESKYIGWTDVHKQGRWRSIHSEEYQQKMSKKGQGLLLKIETVHEVNRDYR